MGVSKNRGVKPPQIIHLFIGFSIIFTIHFGGNFSPYFWFNTHIDELQDMTTAWFPVSQAFRSSRLLGLPCGPMAWTPGNLAILEFCWYGWWKKSMNEDVFPIENGGFSMIFQCYVSFLGCNCWWKKSQTTTWHVWNPVNNGIFTISVQDFFHQQYFVIL